jgi:hypothetical protein
MVPLMMHAACVRQLHCKTAAWRALSDCRSCFGRLHRFSCCVPS